MKANESNGWLGHTIEKLAKCLEERRVVHPRLSPLPLAVSCARSLKRTPELPLGRWIDDRFDLSNRQGGLQKAPPLGSWHEG